MEKFKKTFSFQKKKKDFDLTETAVRPEQWQVDEHKVREGTCSFQVKYLGNIEVYDSRGVQVCEEAIKALLKEKKKQQRAILYVSGDALRVADEISKGLIVDQTIEKVSFCAPDRNHDKGFAYVCRDGTSRRWMCHAFLAVKESGERLSHAVGCAFAICLEKKQKREREAIHLTYGEERLFSAAVGGSGVSATAAPGSGSTMPRTRLGTGSLRQPSLAERLQDPQSAIVTDPSPATPAHSPAPPPTPTPASQSNSNTELATVAVSTTSPGSPAHAPFASPVQGRAAVSPAAIPRPHASASLLERQGSLRLFPRLQETGPFKRDLSLRLSTLPSNRARRQDRLHNGSTAIVEEVGSPVDGEMTLPSRQPPDTNVLPLRPPSAPPVELTSRMEAIRLTPDPFSSAPLNPAALQQFRSPALTHQPNALLSSPEPSTTHAVPNWEAVTAASACTINTNPFTDDPLTSISSSAPSRTHPICTNPFLAPSGAATTGDNWGWGYRNPFLDTGSAATTVSPHLFLTSGSDPTASAASSVHTTAGPFDLSWTEHCQFADPSCPASSPQGGRSSNPFREPLKAYCS